MSQQHDQKSKQTTKRINTGNNTTPIHAYIFLPLAPAYIHAYLLTNIYIYIYMPECMWITMHMHTHVFNVFIHVYMYRRTYACAYDGTLTH